MQPYRTEQTRFSIEFPATQFGLIDFTNGSLQVLMCGEAEVRFFSDYGDEEKATEYWEEVTIKTLFVAIGDSEWPASRLNWWKMPEGQFFDGVPRHFVAKITAAIEEVAVTEASENQGKHFSLPTDTEHDTDNLWVWPTPQHPTGNVQRVFAVAATNF